MLGGTARIERELLLQRADRALAVAEQLENPHPYRMPEHAEEACLHLMDGAPAGRHLLTVSESSIVISNAQQGLTLVGVHLVADDPPALGGARERREVPPR